MSFNVYRAEETIHYGDQDSTFYGWHLATVGSNDSVHPFTAAAQRDAFVALIRRAGIEHGLLAATATDDDTTPRAEELAAVLALAIAGNDTQTDDAVVMAADLCDGEADESFEDGFDRVVAAAQEFQAQVWTDAGGTIG